MATTQHLGPEPPRLILQSGYTSKRAVGTLTVWSSSSARIRVENEMRGGSDSTKAFVRTYHFHRGVWRLVLPWHEAECAGTGPDAVRAMHRDRVDATLAFLALGPNL